MDDPNNLPPMGEDESSDISWEDLPYQRQLNHILYESPDGPQPNNYTAAEQAEFENALWDTWMVFDEDNKEIMKNLRNT
jgi:hypothetical protein